MNEEGMARVLSAFSVIGQEAIGTNAEEVLSNAGLNFHTSMEPLYSSKGKPIKSKFRRIFREDTDETLGVVGRTYRILQNQELANIAGQVVKSGDIMWDRVGMVGNGERLFLSFQLPEGFSFGHGDAEEQIDVFFYLQNSHDGSSGVKVVPSPVRLACSNQFPMLDRFIRKAGIRPQDLTIRHSGLMHERIQDLVRALNIVNHLTQSFVEESTELLNIEMSQDDRITYYIDVLGLKQKEELMKGGEDYDPVNNPYGLGTRGNNTLNRVLELEAADTNNVGDMNGTAWAAFNTVTEYIDHDWCYNKDGSVNDKRVESAILGPAARMKNKAWEIITTPTIEVVQ